MNTKYSRKHFIIDPELQFKFIFAITLIALVEGLFIGWGISRIFAAAANLSKSYLVFDFFKTLCLFLFPLVIGNFLLGAYLSHKVAGPLFRIREALDNLRNGKLAFVQLRQGDLLNNLVKEYNETISVFKSLLQRDQKIVEDSLNQLDLCEDIVKTNSNGGTHEAATELREKMIRKFILIKTFLVAINSHYRQKEEKDYEPGTTGPDHTNS